MRQKLLFLMAVLAFLVPMRLSAFSYTYEGVTLRYSVIDEEAKTCKVDGYKTFSGDLVIPETANDGTSDYTVTEIDKEAFKSCADITSVVIPNSVVTIGKHAFYGCSNLISVKLGESVTTIKVGAFGGCKFTSLEIPVSVTMIEEYALISCYKLTSLVYNAENCTVKMNTVYEEAFPRSLQTVVFGDKVKKIPDNSFNECDRLTSVEFSNSITEIGNRAFYKCTGLTSLELPKSLIEIGSSAFFGCKGLTSIEIPDSVTTIGSLAFDNCYLKSVVLGSSVKEIGRVAFSGSSLTCLEIPESVVEIQDGAFKECNKLSVIIPNSVESLGYNAFEDALKVAYPKRFKNPCNRSDFSTSISYDPESVVVENGWMFSHDKSALIFAPASLEGAYQIPETVNALGYGSFARCNLSSVEIPNSVSEIQERAFDRCVNLESVIIPNSVDTISDYTFNQCKKLKEIIIPNGVVSIGDYAFYDCIAEEIIMGYGIKTIGKRAFRGCPASNIYITAQTPPKIESDTFSDYKGLLHLQGQAAVNAYDNDDNWMKFNNEVMTVPTAMEIEGVTEFSGNAGESFQAKAKMIPEDVSLQYIIWRSTNSRIALVDANGVVTLQEFASGDLTRGEDGEIDGTCKIIAESLYFGGPVAEITIKNSGINGVESVRDGNDDRIDYSKPYEVYNMSGLKVSDLNDGLAKGLYIIRQGKTVEKTVVK